MRERGSARAGLLLAKDRTILKTYAEIAPTVRNMIKSAIRPGR
jgi:hypothetical protein